MLWALAITAFARDLATRVAPATLRRYRRGVEDLAAFASKRRPGALPSDVDRVLLRAFLAHLRERVGPDAIDLVISALRAFWRWMQRRGDVDRNVALELERPKVRRPLPRVLNVDETRALVEAPPASAAGLRDRALLELLYACGLHARQLVALDVDQVELDAGDGLGTLHGPRPLPIGSAACAALRSYLDRRRELVGRRGDARALFVRRGGARLTIARVRRIVRFYGLLGAGRSDVTPRVVRNTFAAHLLDGGADLRVVQILLGHATIAATTRYLGVAVDELVRVYDAAHPLARRAA